MYPRQRPAFVAGGTCTDQRSVSVAGGTDYLVQSAGSCTDQDSAKGSEYLAQSAGSCPDQDSAVVFVVARTTADTAGGMQIDTAAGMFAVDSPRGMAPEEGLGLGSGPGRVAADADDSNRAACTMPRIVAAHYRSRYLAQMRQRQTR